MQSYFDSTSCDAKNAQGYVDPSVWDRGINAAFLSYSASAYKTFNKIGNKETTNAFIL
jgi:outer membrane usher protein